MRKIILILFLTISWPLIANEKFYSLDNIFVPDTQYALRFIRTTLSIPLSIPEKKKDTPQQWDEIRDFFRGEKVESLMAILQRLNVRHSEYDSDDNIIHLTFHFYYQNQSEMVMLQFKIEDEVISQVSCGGTWRSTRKSE